MLLCLELRNRGLALREELGLVKAVCGWGEATMGRTGGGGGFQDL